MYIKWKSKFEFGFFSLIALWFLLCYIGAFCFASWNKVFLLHIQYICIYDCVYMYMCIRMYKIFLRCLLEPQCCYDDVRFVSERPRERNTHTRRNYWILSRRLFECNSERAAVMHVLVCVHVMCLCMCVCACVWAHDGMSSHKKVQLAMTTRWKITHTHTRTQSHMHTLTWVI